VRRLDARPLPKADIDKDMVSYVPRILVVTPSTPVTRWNTNSPCRGFSIHGTRPKAGNDHDFNVAEGTHKTVVLQGPDICGVTCPVRPYARGFIHVVDTPHHAVTDRDGHFQIKDVPLAEYDVIVWHEAAGRLAEKSGPVRVAVKDLGAIDISYKVTPLPSK
jgi:hypothetical protein